MKTILYATDCTKKSASVLRYAYRLSSAMKANLNVLHVYDLPPVSTVTIRTREHLAKSFREEQYEMAVSYCDLHLKNELKTVPVKIQVKESNSIANAISRISSNIDADLVVVGMKDSEALRGLFSGNIANHLLDKTNAPLLIVPKNMNYHGLSTLLYATDFEEADVHAIKNLVDIAEPNEALIKIVHIPRRNEDVEAKMEWFKKKVAQRISYPEIAYSALPAQDVETGLHDYIKSEKADILVMLERKHDSIVDKLFHKDLVRKMEAEISIPLLAFNEKHIRLQLDEQKDMSFSLAL